MWVFKLSTGKFLIHVREKSRVRIKSQSTVVSFDYSVQRHDVFSSRHAQKIQKLICAIVDIARLDILYCVMLYILNLPDGRKKYSTCIVVNFVFTAARKIQNLQHVTT